MSKSKNKSSHSKPIWFTLLGLIGLSLIISALLRGNDVILLNPKGLIANEQHQLMIVSTLIMLGIAVPTLFLLYFFAWRYRETGKKATYNHQSSNSRLSALVFWVIPTFVLIMLASLMLPATQKLEPQRQIEAGKETLRIQVVALRWKWLFIYPEQKIAAVNYVQIPVNTPVKFELTADETPMSSFWIPHLGGQLYAMTEHVNRLNLMADTIGDYEGSAAEINGAGFAGMRFTTRVSSKEDFDLWARETKTYSKQLNTSEYENLARPSENNKTVFYGRADPEIYSNILSKYAGSHKHNSDYEGQE